VCKFFTAQFSQIAGWNCQAYSFLGCGKNVCDVKTIITSLFRDCPEWGGAVVDQKGHFTVAGSKSAKLASEVFGEHTVTEESKTSGKGGSSTNRREMEKPIYKPSELRNLKKYQCIIRHPDGRHKKIYMPPVGKIWGVPYFYYRDRFGILAPIMYLLQWRQ